MTLIINPVGTGNVLKIQSLLHLCSEYFGDKDEEEGVAEGEGKRSGGGETGGKSERGGGILWGCDPL